MSLCNNSDISFPPGGSPATLREFSECFDHSTDKRLVGETRVGLDNAVLQLDGQDKFPL